MTGGYQVQLGQFEVRRFQRRDRHQPVAVWMNMIFTPKRLPGIESFGFVQMATCVKGPNLDESYDTAQRVYGEAIDGYWIDSNRQRCPVFGMRVPDNQPVIPANMVSDNDEVVCRIGVINDAGVQPAELTDWPGRTRPRHRFRHQFESVVIVLSGRLTGTPLGAIHWGYTFEPDGNQGTVNLLPTRVTNQPSRRWRDTLRVGWNTGNGHPIALTVD